MKSRPKKALVPRWNPLPAGERFELARLRFAKRRGGDIDLARLELLERRAAAKS